MTDLTKLTIAQTKAALTNKDFSCQELMQAHIQKIEQNTNLNIYIQNCFDEALKKAAISDERYAKGENSSLEGIPIAVKDLFCTKDIRTTACSKILSNYVPPFESTVTSNLFRHGAIMPGKVNMDEFAMGSANIHSYFGNVINPIMSKDHDHELVPGGSSGGSSACVAGDFAMAALGSDTGGSVRQPASFTGTVGIKPTYGRCSRLGMIAFASSLDQAGVLAKNVEDSAAVLEAIMGYDAGDSTSLNMQIPDLSKKSVLNKEKLVVGIPKEYNAEGMPAEILELWEQGAEKLKQQGAELVEVSLPHTEYALSCYYIIACAEASSNLARYDGVRYGIREYEQGMSIDEMYETTRGHGFGTEVKRRIMLGTYVLSAGYYDAYYGKAQAVRKRIVEDFKNAFKKVDVLLTPTTPSAAFKIGEKQDDPVQMYLNDIFTVPASLAGLPAMSVPAGFTNDKLPLGLQLIAAEQQEQTLYKAAYLLEEAANFDRHAMRLRVRG